VKAGGRHMSAQDSRWIHVGLGDAEEIERVTVRWPGGGTEEFAGVTARARHLLAEGAGAAAAVP